MKKLFLIFALLIAVISVNAQKLVTLTADTVQGAETIYISTSSISDAWDYVTIQALCTQVGGTTDGTMTLMGSVDGTSYVPLVDESGLIKGYPNDSLTMTNGAVQTWIIKGNPFNYYKAKIAGTSADTTLVSIKVALNK